MSLDQRTSTEDLFLKIARLIEESRARIATSVNLAEVYTKYRIGQYIFEEELRGRRKGSIRKASVTVPLSPTHSAFWHGVELFELAADPTILFDL